MICSRLLVTERGARKHSLGTHQAGRGHQLQVALSISPTRLEIAKGKRPKPELSHTPPPLRVTSLQQLSILRSQIPFPVSIKAHGKIVVRQTYPDVSEELNSAWWTIMPATQKVTYALEAYARSAWSAYKTQDIDEWTKLQHCEEKSPSNLLY